MQEHAQPQPDTAMVEPILPEPVSSETQKEAAARSQDTASPARENGTATRAAAEEGQPSEQPAPSIQSPASALADLLSTLGLSTPAPAGKPVAPEPEPEQPENGQVLSKDEDAAKHAAQPPHAARPEDVSVGLVYDPAMEDHVGPPSAPHTLSLTEHSAFSMVPHLSCARLANWDIDRPDCQY